MTVKIGINGFGRIGRNTFRALLGKEELQVVAINDLTDNITLAHLLKYDSLYGKFPGEIALEDANLLVNGREISILAQDKPEKLPWRELGVELVLESTGRFRTHRDYLGKW
ncbi:MAG: Glyceraldehyde-3-phosphate dehydrogenase [Dehalococcoidia bacterium]|nr:Glyceraldehyde-3-phosphate dehydrogenase [Bacillota bacterium]